MAYSYDSTSPSNFLPAVKVKKFHYRHGQALRAPVGQGSQISRQSAHEGVKFVKPYAPAIFTCKKISLVLISVMG
jgi:hypothetical protein